MATCHMYMYLLSLVRSCNIRKKGSMFATVCIFNLQDEIKRVVLLKMTSEIFKMCILGNIQTKIFQFTNNSSQSHLGTSKVNFTKSKTSWLALSKVFVYDLRSLQYTQKHIKGCFPKKIPKKIPKTSVFGIFVLKYD